MEINTFERLWPSPKQIKTFGGFNTPSEIRFTGESIPEWLINDFMGIPGLKITDSFKAYTI